MRNNKHYRSANVDRISNLPCELIHRIVEFLPFIDAIKLRSLSTDWRYRWDLISQFILDDHFFSSVPKLKNKLLQNSIVSDFEILAYSHVVSNVLLYHVGNIRKFVLHIPFWFTNYGDVSHWIQFLSGKFVDELAITLGKEKDFAHNPNHLEWLLPSCVFSCVGFDSLTHLTLVNFSFLPLPSTFRGFPRLISLRLHMGTVQPKIECSNFLRSLVSKCPMLESLDLQIYFEFSSLSIHAPKLQNLVLAGCLFRICWEEIKQIKTLSLQASCDQEWDITIGFFTCLPHVEKLLLGDNFWSSKELLEVAFLEKLKHSNRLRQLKHLVLHRLPLHCRWAIPFIYCLFQTAPKLQELEINVLDTAQSLWHYMIIVDECCLYHLRCAKVRFSLYTSRITLQLIELILLSSPVLEVMTIEVRELIPIDARVRAQEMRNITMQLLEYHRASPNAKIIFKAQPTNALEC